jgi:hypothetical protein
MLASVEVYKGCSLVCKLFWSRGGFGDEKDEDGFGSSFSGNGVFLFSGQC